MGAQAEGVGFEPTVTTSATPVFETGPFNHSGTPPRLHSLVQRRWRAPWDTSGTACYPLAVPCPRALRLPRVNGGGEVSDEPRGRERRSHEEGSRIDPSHP